jgi:hypothetical protein
MWVFFCKTKQFLWRHVGGGVLHLLITLSKDFMMEFYRHLTLSNGNALELSSHCLTKNLIHVNDFFVYLIAHLFCETLVNLI